MGEEKGYVAVAANITLNEKQFQVIKRREIWSTKRKLQCVGVTLCKEDLLWIMVLRRCS
jgi:hypothetical protein